MGIDRLPVKMFAGGSLIDTSRPNYGLTGLGSVSVYGNTGAPGGFSDATSGSLGIPSAGSADELPADDASGLVWDPCASSSIGILVQRVQK